MSEAVSNEISIAQFDKAEEAEAAHKLSMPYQLTDAERADLREKQLQRVERRTTALEDELHRLEEQRDALQRRAEVAEKQLADALKGRVTQREVYQNAVAHGFWEHTPFVESGVSVSNCPHGQITDKIGHFLNGKLMLMVSELAEACEDVRSTPTIEELVKLQIDNGKPVGFTSELADTVIRIMDLCGWLNIDLDEVIRLKHAYNKSRPFKHGKNV